MGMSDYFRELRSLVGDRELLLPSTALLITDSDDRLLLARLRGTGEWATVGGMIEPGESPIEAAEREAREEIRAETRIGQLLGVYGGDGYRVRYPNGDLVAYVVVAYAATLRSRPEPDMDEVTEIGWFSKPDLPALGLGSLNRTLLTELGWMEQR